jgi:DNA-binding IclR family transcriptional regulator
MVGILRALAGSRGPMRAHAIAKAAAGQAGTNVYMPLAAMIAKGWVKKYETVPASYEITAKGQGALRAFS